MRFRLVVLLSALVVLLTACGSPGLGSTSTASLPPTLVGADYNSVTLIESQTDEDGAITGTLTTTTAEEGSSEGPVEAVGAAVNGRIKGARVTLKIDFPLGATSFSGNLDGETLRLRVPRGDGSVDDYVLEPGSVEDYNARVEQMRNEYDVPPSS